MYSVCDYFKRSRPEQDCLIVFSFFSSFQSHHRDLVVLLLCPQYLHSHPPCATQQNTPQLSALNNNNIISHDSMGYLGWLITWHWLGPLMLLHSAGSWARSEVPRRLQGPVWGHPWCWLCAKAPSFSTRWPLSPQGLLFSRASFLQENRVDFLTER